MTEQVIIGKRHSEIGVRVNQILETEELPETKAVARVTEFSKPLISAKDAALSFQHYQPTYDSRIIFSS